MTDSYHTPVLLPEVLHFLLTNPHGAYVDATLGGGGHAEGVLEHLSPRGRLIGIDADPEALRSASVRLARFEQQLTLVHGRFGHLMQILAGLNISCITGIFYDFGVSSRQLDDPDKGFSFRADARLDMRMDPDAPVDAAGLVNSYPVDRLTEVFQMYGEEHQSRRIARAIAAARQRGPLLTTGELANVIEQSVGQRHLMKTLARIFQAIRIEVNNELDQIRNALNDTVDLLEPGGRMVTISYHSLEDRIVKDLFVREAARTIRARHKFEPDIPKQPRLALLTKSPVRPGASEMETNPRARSAKLRAAERTGHPGETA